MGEIYNLIYIILMFLANNRDIRELCIFRQFIDKGGSHDALRQYSFGAGRSGGK